jgi:hypothetical protein
MTAIGRLGDDGIARTRTVNSNPAVAPAAARGSHDILPSPGTALDARYEHQGPQRHRGSLGGGTSQRTRGGRRVPSRSRRETQ